MKIFKIILITSFVVLPVSVNAALIERLGGLAYYDTELDITWLANANAAAGSAFDNGLSPVDGRMTWASAMSWAASLTIGGVSNWRVASMNLDEDSLVFNCSGAPAESEADCKDNEYDHLFSYTGISASSPGPFTGIQSDNRYWSSSERPSNPINDAKTFSFVSGNPGDAAKQLNEFYAWAVHDGDISPVPIPASIWLFVTGLLGLIGVTRRKKA